MSFFNNALCATSTPAKPSSMFATFGGGQTSTPNAFGSMSASTAAPALGSGTSAFGFGSSAPTSTGIPTLGGFGSFGSTATTTTASSFFGSCPATNTAFRGFGSTATATTTPAFGTPFGISNLGSNNLGQGLFGSLNTPSTSVGVAPAFGGFSTTNAPFSAFTSNFGKSATTTVTPGFGAFGGNTAFMMGQPQQQAPQISPDEAFAQSIFNVSIYGDERDTIIAKWNYLQAMWGTGKSFYSQNAPAVEITPQNYLCRFKAMGYSRLPGKENKMGLVALNFNRSLIEIQNQQQQIISTLNAVFGNKPNLLVTIDSSKEFEEKKCQLIIYLEEKSQLIPNETKRIVATDLANYLNQINVKAQLNNIGVIEILALVLPDDDQLKEYLDNAPKGIDPRLWRQAILDNPDPVKFIPVPMIGFRDLKWRIKCQESETETYALYLRKVGKELAELRQRHTAATARIMEQKRKLAELSHSILKIMVKQECTRKVGLALTPEEEALRTKLDNIQALVSAPTQFKGRLSELLSQMRMQRNQFSQNTGSEYTIDKDCEEEMKSFLSMQQKAIEALTDTVNKDLKALRIIMEGMPDLIRA